MREMPEEEAGKLLGQTLRCDDVGCWKIVAANAHKCRTGSGLTDEHGAGTGLTVELQFRMDLRRKCRSYVFSVFKRNRYGVDRVYQLDVNQTPDLPQDDHSRPHEHLGHRRYMGPDEWIAWNYDELLRYFCTRTNIRFRLLPPDPAEILGEK
jgi:hypothetical protein